VKKVPLTSLLLLIFTYVTFGWILYTWLWQTWAIVVVVILVMVLALASPVRSIDIFLVSPLNTDRAAFITIFIGSFVFVCLLAWWPVTIHFLVLLVASLLFRLDLQIAGFSQKQAFWILAIFSLSSMGVGLLMNYLFLS
jgi:hypothetical protein